MLWWKIKSHAMSKHWLHTVAHDIVHIIKTRFSSVFSLVYFLELFQLSLFSFEFMLYHFCTRILGEDLQFWKRGSFLREKPIHTISNKSACTACNGKSRSICMVVHVASYHIKTDLRHTKVGSGLVKFDIPNALDKRKTWSMMPISHLCCTVVASMGRKFGT